MTAARRSLETPSSTALWIAAGVAVPLDVDRRLRAGGAALELGCGRGLGCLALAEAYPQSRVVGQDSDPDVIARARALARVAELEGRVSFAQDTGARLPRATYHLVLVQALSARSGALPLLNDVRNALVPEGVCLVLESRPSLLAAHDVRAGSPEQLRGLAMRAGFSHFSLLGHAAVEIYELRR